MHASGPPLSQKAIAYLAAGTIVISTGPPGRAYIRDQVVKESCVRGTSRCGSYNEVGARGRS